MASLPRRESGSAVLIVYNSRALSQKTRSEGGSAMLGRIKGAVNRRLVAARRRRWADTIRRNVAACGPELSVNHPSRISHAKNVTLGTNVNFNGMTIYGGGGVAIGDNFHSGEGCFIISANHDYDGGEAIPYGRGVIGKKVVIEDNVWLGLNVIINAGVRIAEGAIVAAGSVVTKDVERCSIVGGNPAKHIRYRDIAHYEELKAQGRFL